MAIIIAELLQVMDRIYDRWENAFWSIRSQDYSGADLARDWADAMMDATYLTMLPGARLNGLELHTTGHLAIARFIVTDKTAPITQVVRVDGGAGVLQDALTNSVLPAIPAVNYAAVLALDGTNYLYVTVNCPAIDAIPTAAGVYAGYVRDTAAGNAPIARVIVVWPG